MSITPGGLSSLTSTACSHFVTAGQKQSPSTCERIARIRSSVARLQATFELDNDLSIIVPMIQESEQLLARRYGEYDESYRFPLVTSLEEALRNAIVHGNLEVSSELQIASNSGAIYDDLISKRPLEPPYCDRRVHLGVTLGRERVILVVRDQGPGFDVDKVPDPTNPENLDKPYGRGLALMRHFMDSVVHNDMGNVVTMIKRAPTQYVE